jgi:hypothetical protein
VRERERARASDSEDTYRRKIKPTMNMKKQPKGRRFDDYRRIQNM